MSENKNNYYGRAIVASVGIISICTASVMLKTPMMLFGLILVAIVTSWAD